MKQSFELTQQQMDEIDEIFKQYKGDDEDLLAKLDKYKSPEGWHSLYVRWQFDTL